MRIFLIILLFLLAVPAQASFKSTFLEQQAMTQADRCATDITVSGVMSTAFVAIMRGIIPGAGPMILAKVLEGSAVFSRFVETNLDSHREHDVPIHSAVHDDEVVRGQSFVLGVTSQLHALEIVPKTVMTYAAHVFDDLLDQPERVSPRHQLTLLEGQAEILHGNFDPFTATLGPNVAIPHSMVEMGSTEVRKNAIRRSLWRIMWGGLIQQSTGRRQFRSRCLLYQDTAVHKYSPEFAARIRSILPTVYWTTTKTALEEMVALEEDPYKPELVEVWNLIFGPLLFYQDIEDEIAREGMNRAIPNSLPFRQIEYILFDLAARTLARTDDPRLFYRLQQLAMVLALYQDSIPHRVIALYQEFIHLAQTQLLDATKAQIPGAFLSRDRGILRARQPGRRRTIVVIKLGGMWP